MPAADALSIWSASIEAAAAAGDLQAYVVAGHFVALAHRSEAWREHAPDARRTESFISHHERRMIGWLQAWQAEDPGENTAERAALGLRFLQFFDALSLWFCCAEAREPLRIETPAGPRLTLIPCTPEQLTLIPWPLAVERLELELVARSVAVERYASAARVGRRAVTGGITALGVATGRRKCRPKR